MAIGRKLCKWLRSKRYNAELTFDGSQVQIAMPFRDDKDINVGLDASTAWSIDQMKRGGIPRLYDSGVRYKREPVCRINGRERMCEEFVTAPLVVARGVGDCDDLGGYRAAELKLAGEDARAFARRSAAGWHVVVRRADGSIEDPSAKLGMPLP